MKNNYVFWVEACNYSHVHNSPRFGVLQSTNGP